MSKNFLSLDSHHMNDILSEQKCSLPFQSIFAIQEITALSPQTLKQLSEKEQLELNSFRNEKRKREFASSRRLLKQLADEWGLPREEFTVYKNKLGNPFAKTASDRFEVSIAHTEEVVFGGISSQEPIGIDLEPSDRKVSDRVRARMMHPIEKKNGLNIPTIRLWTIKEAYIKLRGQGLRLNMNDVCVQHEVEKHFIIKLNKDKTAKICSFTYQSNWLAIAYYL